MSSKQGTKQIAFNKKARFNLEIEDEYEAGIVLKGTEVKSVKAGKISLKESFAKIKNSEVFIYNLHIAPYSHAYFDNHDPMRPRKLLLNKREIKKLIGKTNEKGYTLLPTKVYLKNGRVKLGIAIGRGKKLHDKRRAIKEREVKRELDRNIKKYRQA
ncbi:MAG: SsrA-binding protein [Deltaproteobacteria bacterium]|nr:MAG: SsrA-binding protein [Deltaproteobacteria bacterium]